MVNLDTKLVFAKPLASCFDQGSYKVITKKVKKNSSKLLSNPPLYIVSPKEKGTYPVIVFLHGFSIPPSAYSDLFNFIASHGYIIVAPRQTPSDFLRSLFICSAIDDVDSAAETSDWINENKGNNLQLELPEGVSPDLEHVALAGHSKGGKAAFALALGYAKTSLKFKALIGLDPVAGPSPSNRLEPKILDYLLHNFNIKIPVAVIGTGLSDDSFCGCLPPAAPWGCNHPFFFNECKPPSCYFVAKEYGHMDMTDGFLAWLAGIFISKSGKGSKVDMRRACGGIFVAFLKAYFFNDTADLTSIVDSPDSVCPIKLNPTLWLQS